MDLERAERLTAEQVLRESEEQRRTVAALNTLARLGYVWNGGELWEPPVDKRLPRFDNVMNFGGVPNDDMPTREQIRQRQIKRGYITGDGSGQPLKCAWPAGTFGDPGEPVG